MQKYAQLFLTSAKVKKKGFGKCLIFAFTSALEEEGVSYVAQSFGTEVARLTSQRTLIADSSRLMHINIGHYTQIMRFCRRTDVRNLWVLPGEDFENDSLSSEDLVIQPDNPGSYLENCFSNLLSLRFAFDYVLLDCPALSVSEEASLLAPETDGVICVVEADNTKREQIQVARQTIENANGKFLGFVLNKRQYPVPDWLYKRL